MSTQIKASYYSTLIMMIFGLNVAHAQSDDLLHKALSDSFSQRAEVQKSYKELLPNQQVKEPLAAKDKSIAIDMGDELGASPVREKEAGLEFRDKTRDRRASSDDAQVREMNRQYKEAFAGQNKYFKRVPKRTHRK